MIASRSPLIDFFSRALSSFQNSGSKFQVICTVPSTHPTRRDNGQLPMAIPPPTRPPTLIVLDSSFNPPTIAHLRMATSALRNLTEEKGSQLNTVRLLLLLAVNNADKAPKPAPFDQRLALMWAFAKDLQNGLSAASNSSQDSHVETEVEQKQDSDGLNIDVALSTEPYFHEKSAAIARSDFYKPSQNGKDDMEQVILAGYDTMIRIFNPKYYGTPTSTAHVMSTGTATTQEPQTPIQKALDPFFARAKLRVTLRTDDEWGGKEDQLEYLRGLLTVEGLSKIGGSESWGDRVEMVEGRKVGEDIVSSTYARDAAKNRDWGKLSKMVSPDVKAWIEQEGMYRV